MYEINDGFFRKSASQIISGLPGHIASFHTISRIMKSSRRIDYNAKLSGGLQDLSWLKGCSLIIEFRVLSIDDINRNSRTNIIITSKVYIHNQASQ